MELSVHGERRAAGAANKSGAPRSEATQRKTARREPHDYNSFSNLWLLDEALVVVHEVDDRGRFLAEHDPAHDSHMRAPVCFGLRGFARVDELRETAL